MQGRARRATGRTSDPRGTVIIRHIFVFVTSVGRSMLPSSIVRPMTPTPDVVLTSTVVQAEASAPRHMRLRMSGIVPTCESNARDGQ